MKKDFDEIYDEVYAQCKDQILEVRKKNKIISLIMILILIVLNIVGYLINKEVSLLVITSAISVLVFIVMETMSKGVFRRVYKETVIQNIISKYSSSLYFDPHNGLPVMNYLASRFDDTFEEYHSEDRIYGTIEGDAQIQLSEVTTYDVKEYKDDEGNIRTEKIQTFRGLYGMVKLAKNPRISATIITNNIWKKYSKRRVEIDSAEFEEYYDCITDDKVKTMQIFTSELIQKYIDIMQEHKYTFELKIENDILYFRYKCGNVFEPPIFGTGLDKNFLKKYYDMIHYPLEIIESTVENINSFVDIN